MKKWGVIVVLAIAQFVMVLDSTVMNVSISAIVKDLNTSVTSLQTAITFYALTMAALMLLGAKLCSKWGLLRAFSIGAIVYGAGSFITAISPNIATLFIGWSIIEGLGAVLVIPAITALVATNYSGKMRVTAYAIIGGISGAAAAAGPLIGGFVTTYLSWRYVFLAETLVMIYVLYKAKSFKDGGAVSKQPIDAVSVVLSSVGLVLIVYGMLQSKVWGWVEPLSKPEIFGKEVAPLGVSLVTYLIISGIILLKLFFDRQHDLMLHKKEPLLDVSLLSRKALRASVSVLTSQYLITGAIFFVVPIYLQMVLGLDALQTGIKILPLSFALIVFSFVGSRMSHQYTPKTIVKGGQVLLIVGSFALLTALDPQLTGGALGLSFLCVGAGLGLLASQLANVAVGAAGEENSSQVGGINGTFQNLGSSLGTALIGSIIVLSLTNGFVTRINASTLPDNIKSYVQQNSTTGVAIVPPDQVQQYALSEGSSIQEAEDIATIYGESQLQGLKQSVVALIVIAVLSMLLSKNIPNKLAD